MRARLRQGASLTPSEQEVADDLDAACRRRQGATSAYVIATVLVVVYVIAILGFAFRSTANHQPLQLFGLPVVVVVVWLDWAFARTVATELSRHRSARPGSDGR